MEPDHRSALFKIAARLAAGDMLPSGDPDDLRATLPKTTPKQTIRQFSEDIEHAREQCRLLAIELRRIANYAA